MIEYEDIYTRKMILNVCRKSRGVQILLLFFLEKISLLLTSGKMGTLLFLLCSCL